MRIRPSMSTRDWFYAFIQGQYLTQLWEADGSSCELYHFQVLKAHIPITTRHRAIKILTTCFFLVQLCIHKMACCIGTLIKFIVIYSIPEGHRLTHSG